MCAFKSTPQVMDIYSPNYTTGTFGHIVKGLVEPSGSISFSTQMTDKPFQQAIYPNPHNLLANPRTFLSPPDQRKAGDGNF